MTKRTWTDLLAGALLSSLLSFGMGAGEARACGCLTMNNPAAPVLQAAEQILFAMKDGVVTAHIQIRYMGSASDFGWLVPLPSVPTLELGVDELFTQLAATTTPSYFPTNIYDPRCPGPAYMASSASSSGCGGGFATESASPGHAASEDGGSVEVVQSSVGPYDYAVLKADDKSAMLDWLKTNNYFIPTSSDAALLPYIHPGAFFLALKLRPGENTGNLQPIVIHYNSDLPMIPIVLTSVGATASMPIKVFILGGARAIPRNYNHIVLDEALIDWSFGGSNYLGVVAQAIAETAKKHAFVTEYAGPSKIMQDILDAPGRFGDLDALRAITDRAGYVAYLRAHGYAFNGDLYGILIKYIPIPRSLAGWVTLDGYFKDVNYWRDYDSRRSGLDGGVLDGDAGAAWDIPFDPKAATDEIQMRLIAPALAAGALFKGASTLTRLYTQLSPADMNLDPVFSFNPDLPPVPVARKADLHFNCSGDAKLTTATDKLVVEYPMGRFPQQYVTGIPSSLRIENLREAGAPEIVVDNTATITRMIDTINSLITPYEAPPSKGGCAVAAPTRRGDFLFAVGLAFAAVVLRRARRKA